MFLRTKLTVSALILSLGACSATALAQQPQPTNSETSAQQPGRAGLPRRVMRRRARIRRQHTLAQINLTDAQKQQVRTIIQTQGQNTETQREELRHLMQQWRTGTLTAQGQARAKELRQQLMESRKGVHAQMQNVLTAEQKAKLHEMRELRRANHEKFGRRKPPLN
ncbi:MAG TPA: Spy/CpxP family protein refolding chaperone [Pyrinomonadaceae bacterium]|nr:Spy/CpxP family protein refolding chaperone [Pyrinomonadaceae bacterium]